MKLTGVLIAIYFAIINSCSVVEAGVSWHPPLVHGALNPAVTQANIDSTICVKNWTDTIRPDTRYTNAIKYDQMAFLNIRWEDRKKYEEDHWIALSIGGAPKDKFNLVLIPYFGKCNANDKNRLEGVLHRMVCAKPRQITLARAQHEMQHDWAKSYNLHVASLKRKIPKLVCN